MDKQQAKEIREKATAHLATLGEELGLSITLGRGTFDSGQITFKVEFAEIGEGGLVKSKEAGDFEAYAYRYNMESEDLGAEFVNGAKRYTIVGCKPRSSKFPILAKCKQDGKTYKFPAASVVQMLTFTRNIEAA